MLHFFSGVYNDLFGTPEFNVLIVGREHAGKSTLMEQLKFLYTPATQQREAEAISQGENRRQHVPWVVTPSCNGGSKPTTATKLDATDALVAPPPQPLEQPQQQLRERPLPPGLLLPATPEHLAQKRIRPTVGLNYAVVHHRFSPPVSSISRVKQSQLSQRAIASLPPPPEDVLAEQRARHQALMASAPSEALTRVVLRDLGGQVALRNLWARYYPLSQGLVYVVDSTLPSRVLCASSSQAPAAAPPPRDHFTGQELEEVYKEDRELLMRLLQHPLLRDVPVLLLSNKADNVSHISLTSLQEALRLAELASDPTFYMPQHSGDSDTVNGADQCRRRQHCNTKGGSPLLSSSPNVSVSLTSEPLSRHCAGSEKTQRQVGASGFGEISMRVMEVSALNGMGVTGAMDWLVAQLLHRARNVDANV
ncbi:hypothetical protein JKF63_04269 [Porcisia hertigi]|uniref:Uncharacterized protein n=1 Tax=Porcisia hertigi TaxID=2761500 RepID=A0A836LHG1_9TRYP|nr:hypothetical protein JKF63_04269 [Porcisia hertigi]